MLKLVQSLDTSMHQHSAFTQRFQAEILLNLNEAKLFIFARLAPVFCDRFWWELGS